VLERAPQPVELPDDEGIAGPEEGERFGQSDAFVLGTAGDVGEELPAAGLLERVLLEIEVLVLGRDTRVADEHAACGPTAHCAVRKVCCPTPHHRAECP